MRQASKVDDHPSPHMSALIARHAALEAKIQEEQAKLKPDSMKLQNLKRQKLAIKDDLNG